MDREGPGAFTGRSAGEQAQCEGVWYQRLRRLRHLQAHFDDWAQLGLPLVGLLSHCHWICVFIALVTGHGTIQPSISQYGMHSQQHTLVHMHPSPHHQPLCYACWCRVSDRAQHAASHTDACAIVCCVVRGGWFLSGSLAGSHGPLA